MYKRLIELSDYLDKVGYIKYSNYLDQIIKNSGIKDSANPINLPEDIIDLEQVLSNIGFDIDSSVISLMKDFVNNRISYGEYINGVLKGSVEVKNFEISFVIPNSNIPHTVEIFPDASCIGIILEDVKSNNFAADALVASPIKSLCVAHNLSNFRPLEAAQGLRDLKEFSSQISDIESMGRIFFSDIESSYSISGNVATELTDPKSRGFHDLKNKFREVISKMNKRYEVKEGCTHAGFYDESSGNIALSTYRQPLILKGNKIRFDSPYVDRSEMKKTLLHEIRHSADYKILNIMSKKRKDKILEKKEMQAESFYDSFSPDDLFYKNIQIIPKLHTDKIFDIDSRQGAGSNVRNFTENITRTTHWKELTFINTLVEMIEDECDGDYWDPNLSFYDKLESLLKNFDSIMNHDCMSDEKDFILGSINRSKRDIVESLRHYKLEDAADKVSNFSTQELLEMSAFYVKKRSYLESIGNPKIKNKSNKTREPYKDRSDTSHALRESEYETYLGDIRYDIRNSGSENINSIYEYLKSRPFSYQEKEDLISEYGKKYSDSYRQYLKELNDNPELDIHNLKERFIRLIFKTISDENSNDSDSNTKVNLNQDEE